MNQVLKKEKLILDKSQLLKPFYEGGKEKSSFKVGIEFEKLGIYNDTLSAINYSGSKGVSSFLQRYKDIDIFQKEIKEDDFLLGFVKDSGSITLEPGSQLEYSISPQSNIHQLYYLLNDYNDLTARLAQDFGIKWIGSGINPVSVFDDIELIPKKRYEIMKEYLPTVGKHSLNMMKESAGIQVCFDYACEEDAAYKLKVSLGLSPIINAIFANSPIRNAKETGFKSFRSYAWLYTDKARCGLIGKKAFSNYFTFEDYVDILLDVPMLFLQKEGNWFNMNGMPFSEYLKNGYKGYKATIEDWNLHISGFFPDVRLKNYIEIRNCDCQRSELLPAVPAIWKGLIYNYDAMTAAWNLVKDLTWEDRLYLAEQAPKYALDTKIRGKKLINIAKELLSISISSLKNMAELNEDKLDESIYLEELKELLAQNKTPADKILELWNTSWNKDKTKLVEYLTIK